ncbi:MAG: RHS repeat-associated core domain-containing protein [Bacteroidota bacterium]
MTYELKEHQYTLYYYDLEGNLVQTVPPQGVNILNATEMAAENWAQAVYVFPNHQMETRYQYNGLNNLIAQFTPDGGRTDFYLDKLYRVRFSQNARQVLEDKVSYNKYDELGRVMEGGEFALLADNLGTIVEMEAENNSFPEANRVLDYTKTYFENTYTDAGITAVFINGQENLRNAVGAIEHRQAEYLIGTNVTIEQGTEHKTVISYSYDPHKNVKQVVNTNYDLASVGHQHKTTEYFYDLISGNLNEAVYQQTKVDQYRHRFHYDAKNRLVRAFTSDNDGLTWEMDAKYFYYLHGALARTELGNDKVQGMDYAYNLQGWLKGVNSSTLQINRDLGKDANNGLNENFGEDIMGFQLGYFAGDYTPIGIVDAFANTTNLNTRNIHTDNVNKSNLFNSNISHMITAIRNFDEKRLDILGNNYRHDQLQRIKAMDVYYDDSYITNNAFGIATQLYHYEMGEGAYQERYSFDDNGNFIELKRNGSGRNAQNNPVGLQMDNFTYHYYDQGNNNATTVTDPVNSNRLAYVQESVDDLNNPDPYGLDIRYALNQNQLKYEYDASGQLTADPREGIEKIEWTVTGKVKFIKFTAASNKKNIRFLYDPIDRRVAKLVYNDNTDGSSITYTHYSHDAQGNVLATYTRETNLTSTSNPEYNQYTQTLTLNDHHIYGSQRIGVENQNKRILNAVQLVPSPGSLFAPQQVELHSATYDYTERIVEDKNYELANHLGNVLDVITDRKIGYDYNTDNEADHYIADVISFSDYGPYGQLLDGRHGRVTDKAYRYGFQKQEGDDEIKGEGNSINYEYRMYDPRIGRFFAIDPLSGKYPELTPYQFSSNITICSVELEGLEHYQAVSQWYKAFEESYTKAGMNEQQKEKARMDVLKGQAVVAGATLAVISVMGAVYAVTTYGVVTVAGYLLEETVEFLIEEGTGIPIIIDPIDVLEQLVKKGAKKFASDVIIEGRKFAKGASIKQMKAWAWNVKEYGKDFAQLISKGDVTISQAKTLIANGIKGFKREANGAWSKTKYRDNLRVATGYMGKGYDAHHTLPKEQALQSFFTSKGIDVNDPANLIWREEKSHRGKTSADHLKMWKEWVKNNPDATKEDIFKQRDKIEKAVWGNTKGDTPTN